MPKQNFKFELYVEGINDKHAITQLMLKHNFNNIYSSKDNRTGNLEIKIPEENEEAKTNGIDGILNGVLEDLPTIVKAGSNKTIGIIVDADLNSNNRWQQIKDRLLKAGYNNIPDKIPSEGFISSTNQNNGVIVGVWIMPNNNDIGKIEDFLQYLIPNKEQNKLFRIAQEAISKLEYSSELIESDNRFKDIDSSKALIHTWLAWQNPPAKPFGTAINATLFNSHADEALKLIDWLERLFNK